MIIEIALGVALGVLILHYRREIYALGAIALLFGILFAVVIVGGICLYMAWKAAASSAIMQATSPAFAIIFGVAVNLLIPFAFGQALEQRTSLQGWEAYILGAILYALFIITAIMAPWLFTKYHEEQPSELFFYLALLSISWTALISLCWQRNRINQRQLFAGKCRETAA